MPSLRLIGGLLALYCIGDLRRRFISGRAPSNDPPPPIQTDRTPVRNTGVAISSSPLLEKRTTARQRLHYVSLESEFPGLGMITAS